ncbi:hypothetical protein SAMN02745163_04497 [Clostridium cavendishii DSM 21758]|uniref:Uncharacterized protein n=1 Tax=Clostridium cavendishii DSM 21758 TaxID=1121302 RepID=A0A1M6VHC5_9CLOT|nr:hypothetical protein SAMN02745163_04497 [Clostridium cavendishii DSM 21758]
MSYDLNHKELLVIYFLALFNFQRPISYCHHLTTFTMLPPFHFRVNNFFNTFLMFLAFY